MSPPLPAPQKASAFFTALPAGLPANPPHCMPACAQIAKLRCEGKHAANMKLLVAQLEERTGGIVVHKAGGTVFLYRAEPWPRAPPAFVAAAVEAEEEEERDSSGVSGEAAGGSAAGAAAAGAGQRVAAAASAASRAQAEGS